MMSATRSASSTARADGTTPLHAAVHADRLDPELVSNTMNVILKFQEDIENVQPELRALTQKAVGS